MKQRNETSRRCFLKMRSMLGLAYCTFMPRITAGLE